MNEWIEKIKTLEEQILKEQHCVPFDLFVQWRNGQQAIGEDLIHEAFSFIAKHFHAYILSNPVNSISYAHFIRQNVRSKNYFIRDRTSHEGIQGGFIVPPSTILKSFPLKFPIGPLNLLAVSRKGDQLLTQFETSEDIFLQACCDEEGNYITSDIDLLFIIFKHADHTVIQDNEYGELTKSELVLVKALNHQFQQLVNNYLGDNKLSCFKPVAHGPANRFSQSKTSHIHYPIRIYSPDGTIQSLGNESQQKESLKMLIEFLKTIQLQKYEVLLNPCWDL